jgi:hypothetical protein
VTFDLVCVVAQYLPLSLSNLPFPVLLVNFLGICSHLRIVYLMMFPGSDPQMTVTDLHF